jgi:hypothetical protein
MSRHERVFCVVVFAILLGPHAGPQAFAQSLIADGKSDYVIVLPATPQPVETTAAAELQRHLIEVTGVTLPMVSEKEVPSDAKLICVGPSARAKQFLPSLDVTKLGPDGIVMKTAGANLVLAGQGSRGTLYAVYSFLEDVVGCRWWTSQESFVPRQAALKLPSLDVTYTPPLRYREAFYRDAFDGLFATRLKCNGHHHQITPEYGGHDRFAGFVHTFYPLLPPKKYFAEHPEWYSLVKGKRNGERAQLCLTNDAMRAELVHNALARLRTEPQAGVISISQNDWHGRCECDRCRAVEEEEGSPSGLMLRFVNAVAEEIEKEFPAVLVETLAYQYTRQPPRLVKPRRNVVVRLCSIECSFAQPLADPHNEKFRADIEGWSQVAPQLFVWDYVTNFSNYILPHPNLRVLAPNVRFFVDHHVVGLFEQGDAGSTVGDFVRLRAWLLAHLMWNPRLDEKALVAEFLKGYYQAASPHLSAYLDVIQEAGARSGKHLRCFMPDTSSWLTLDDLNQATHLFDQALKAVAGDPVLEPRVRRERLPLDHAWLQRYYALKRQSQMEGKEFAGPQDPLVACDEFLRLARQWKAGQYRERCPMGDYEEMLRRKFRAPAPAPVQCRGLPKDAWLDIQDNEFRLAKQGEWSKLVEDPQASDGHAARMPGDHYEWAVSYPISADLGIAAWRCYVVVRCEAQATDGPAMTIGIYDSEARRGVTHRKLSVAELAGKGYQAIDLGVHELRPGMYVWAAPPKRPGEVTAVYVDRILLVRTAKTPSSPSR